MSRPSQLPVSSDHASHDVLLVSQLAAGDPIEPARQRQADALLASCAECAMLVSDLATLATAVAWEPIPPRRRDFRLSTEAAEQARGSRFDRLMRRFTLPGANGLRPVAAGVMSLGLVLVIAGNFWPEDVFEDATTQEVAAPRLELSPAADLQDSLGEASGTLEMEAMAASGSPAVGDTAGSGSAPAQPQANESRDDLAAREAIDAGAQRAGDTLALEASPSEAAAPQGDSLSQGFASKAADSTSVNGSEPDQDATPVGEAGAEVSEMAALTEAAADASSGSTELAMPSGAAADDTAMSADPGATAASGGTSIESIVTIAGLGLLVVGALLWSLVLVARRRESDQFAR